MTTASAVLAALAEGAKNPLWGWLGWLGQGVFGIRFLVQWVATEKAKRVVVPEFFWYLSIIGSLLSLMYAISIPSYQFMVGQITGTVVYVRNLHLHRRHVRSEKAE